MSVINRHQLSRAAADLRARQARLLTELERDPGDTRLLAEQQAGAAARRLLKHVEDVARVIDEGSAVADVALWPGAAIAADPAVAVFSGDLHAAGLLEAAALVEVSLVAGVGPATGAHSLFFLYRGEAGFLAVLHDLRNPAVNNFVAPHNDDEPADLRLARLLIQPYRCGYDGPVFRSAPVRLDEDLLKADGGLTPQARIIEHVGMFLAAFAPPRDGFLQWEKDLHRVLGLAEPGWWQKARREYGRQSARALAPGRGEP